MSEYLNIREFLVLIFYLIIALYVILKLSSNYGNSSIRKYFLLGALSKVLGGQLVCLVYIFIYKYGDTFRFFRFGLMYKDILTTSEEYSFLEALFMSNDAFKSAIAYKIDYAYGFAESSFIINKISGIISIFTLDSFFATTLIFSLLSFSGVWKMFQVFVLLYPRLHRDFALAILFLPSLVFWGSGLLKDSICIGGLGWITWGVYGLFFNKYHNQSKTVSLVAVAVASWLVYSIKTYVAVSFLAGVFLWIVLSYRDRIKNQVLRFLVLPLLLILTLPILYFGLSAFSEELGRYAIDNVIQTALDQTYNLHRDLSAGSTYSLGSINPSLAGMLSKIPAAINVTLFRPYPWEISNATMAAAMLESLMVLFLVIYVFVKVKIKNVLSAIIDNGVILFCMSYSLTFSFFVGLSSGNFGSLVRYKIPAIPYFLAGIILLFYFTTGKSLIDSMFFKEKKQPKV